MKNEAWTVTWCPMRHLGHSDGCCMEPGGDAGWEGNRSVPTAGSGVCRRERKRECEEKVRQWYRGLINLFAGETPTVNGLLMCRESTALEIPPPAFVICCEVRCFGSFWVSTGRDHVNREHPSINWLWLKRNGGNNCSG